MKKPSLSKTTLIALVAIALISGAVIGQIMYQLTTPAEITLAVNTYGLSLWEEEAMTNPVTQLTFDGTLMGDVPGSQQVDVYAWLAPNDDPTSNEIRCYLTMDLSGLPSGITLTAGHFEGAVYQGDITYDGSDNFYSFVSGWTDSTEDPIRMRWRLTVVDAPAGTYNFDVDITGENA